MKCFTLYTNQVDNRLDPLFYSQDILHFLKKTPYAIKTLEEVCQYFKAGFAAGSSMQDDTEKGVIQIRPTNIDEEGLFKFDKNIYINGDTRHTDDLLKKNEVLFNNTNSQEWVGKTAYLNLEGKYFCSNHITRIGVNIDNILPKYLWIILNFYQKKQVFFNICTNWNNQSGVNVDLLKTVKIPLPSFETQNRIVSIMQSAYEQKKQKEQEAEKLLGSIEEYMLDELGIKFPNLKDEKYYILNSQELKNARLDPFYHQPKFHHIKPALNKGKYELLELNRVADFISGYAFSSNSYISEDGVKLLTIKNIKNTGICSEDFTQLPKDYINKFSAFKIIKGDVVIAMTGATIGKATTFDLNDDVLLNQRVGIIRCKEKANRIFINAIINANFFKQEIIRRSVGGAQPNISENEITSIPIPLPPLAIQNKISEEIKRRMTEAEKLKTEARSIIEKAKQEIEATISGK